MKRWSALPLIVVSTTAAAQEKSEYTVVDGDTCEVVAKKVYGDPKRYDLLHEANPQLGAPPHKLKAGMVLRTPAPGAAAKVTFIRKDVEASTPGSHTAKLNEDLDRGHRVSTLADSSAEVTFKDTSRLQLSEHTLVVILGGANTLASSKQATAGDTTLLSGELRAHLGTLAGKKPIATPGATVDVGGEAKISVDPKSATRLAVYKGKSALAASGAKVDVQEGFGSKAELGKAPTKPLPLPKAPTWSTPIPRSILTMGDADVSGTFTTSETVDKFHVQLARDSGFNDLIVDARLPATVTKLEAKALPEGTYFARVSAIDADLFEGAYGELASLRVTKVAAKPATATTSGSVDVNGMFCGLDGAPLVAATTIELPRGGTHVLRCALTANGEGAAALTFDEKYAGAAPIKKDEPAPVIYAVQGPPRVRPWELSVFLGGHDAHRRLGIGSMLAVEASAHLAARYVVVSIGLRPFWERYGVSGDYSGHTADVFGAGVPITARLRRYGWTPILSMTPQLMHDRVLPNMGVTVDQALRERVASRTAFALQLGVGLRLGNEGPWALQLEAGYRLTPTHAIENGDVSLSGAYASLAGRFGF